MLATWRLPSVMNWMAVTFGALWTAGLALMLATFGYCEWLAAQSGRTRRELLSESSRQWVWWTAVLLVAAGFSYTLAERWWQTFIWVLLSIASAWQLLHTFRRRHERTIHDRMTSTGQ